MRLNIYISITKNNKAYVAVASFLFRIIACAHSSHFPTGSGSCGKKQVPPVASRYSK